jgi:PAS domain S-box-containing protein
VSSSRIKDAKTILLVEDEVLIRTSEERDLQAFGYTTLSAESGEQALDIVTTNPDIDLILMDIDLGDGIDGTETAEIILRDKEIPVVFLSSHTEPAIVEKTEKITSYGYVVKNSGKTVLDASIKMAFKLYDARKKEQKLFNDIENREKLFHDVLSVIPDMVSIHDPDMNILYSNWKGIADVPESKRKVNTKCFMTYRGYSEICPDCMAEGVLKTGKAYHAEHKLPDDIWIDLKIIPVCDQSGSCIYFVEWVRDITKQKNERIQYQQDLIESIKRFEIINTISSDYAYCHKVEEDGSYNPYWHIGSFDTITGYTPEELHNLGGWEKLIHPDDIPGAYEYAKKLLSGLEASYTARIITKDGSTRWIRDRGAPWFDAQSGKVIGTFGSANDITTEKENEIDLLKAKENLHSILDNSDDYILIADSNGKAVLFNNAYRQIMKDTINLDMSPGIIPHKLIADPELVKWWDNIHKRVLSGESFHIEFPYDMKERGICYFEFSYNPIIRDNVVEGFIEISRDITEHKDYEKNLQTAVKQKDLLMKELNHRVKNNITMISSLLMMKNEELGGKCDLSDIHNRIETIRIVHENLLKEEDVTRISFREYIDSILQSVFSFKSKTITLNNEIENIVIDTKRAIALGLIINEMATNAIKHGFTDNKLYFSIKMEHNSERYTLVVSNTGRPFPETVDITKPESMGLQLILMLVTQINGTIELEKEPNPEFTITFPVNQKKR